MWDGRYHQTDRVISMSLQAKIKSYLDQIKIIPGIENAVLTQRDGNPIQSTGVWLSKNEIFEVCSAASAIFNVGIYLHPDQLKFILIEGDKAKVLIAPLRTKGNSPLDRVLSMQGLDAQDNEYFIAITTRPNANLGGIFLKTREALLNIKRALVTSGESFKPPLVKYNQQRVREMLSSFDLKEDLEVQERIARFTIGLPVSVSKQIEELIHKFSLVVQDLQFSCLTLNGGFIISSYTHPSLGYVNVEAESAMNYSLYSTANRCAWLLKKMRAKSVLLECDTYFQFMTAIRPGLFSAQVGKGRTKLGILRLVVPKYAQMIQSLVEQAIAPKKVPSPPNLREVLGSLVVK
ncbi:MAG: hypothetical protein Kow0069_02150 [Promethearchaeota archaeon]